MKSLSVAIALVLLPAPLVAQAQGSPTSRTLNDGKVHFSVPADWTAVMEKTDGDPQAIAYSVPDPGSGGSDTTATVTVKTRALAAPSAFAGAVQDELERAKQQPGYTRDTAASSDPSVSRYTTLRGKVRYSVADRYFLTGNIAVQVRCQRPEIAANSAEWNAAFDRACAGVFESLKSGAPAP